MKPTCLALAVPLLFSAVACVGIKLPPTDEEVSAVIMRLVTSQEADASALAPDVAQLNRYFLDTYEGAYVPVPEEDLVEFDPARPRNYTEIDALRWGQALPAHPENSKTVSAFVARPVSAGYPSHIALTLDGDWREMFPTNFRFYVRTFTLATGEQFVSGSVDRAEVDNTIEVKAERGIVFKYDSHTVFRRIRDSSLPEGEAVLQWERMAGEAERLEGGYGAYLRFLVNFKIYVPFTEKLSWRFDSSWSEAGGSLFIFEGGATSGQVANGIRSNYVDFESYLSEHGLSCGPDCL